MKETVTDLETVAAMKEAAGQRLEALREEYKATPLNINTVNQWATIVNQMSEASGEYLALTIKLVALERAQRMAATAEPTPPPVLVEYDPEALPTWLAEIKARGVQ
jgi:hypothetical protein